jgi:hypothetical protein
MARYKYQAMLKVAETMARYKYQAMLKVAEAWLSRCRTMHCHHPVRRRMCLLTSASSAATADAAAAAALVVVGVIGVTLFPLAPHSVRLAVLYLLSGLLSVLLGTMALRYVVWFAVWLATGSHFWLLPNMMSEEVRLDACTAFKLPSWSMPAVVTVSNDAA